MGFSGVQFLSLESGARPIGMGGAFTSITADPHAGAYNPAASSGIEVLTGSFGHNTYWKNRRFETGFLSFPKGSFVFNVGLQYSEVKDIEARQSATSEPDYYFNSPDFSIKAGFSYPIIDIVQAGFSLGWVFEKIDTYRGHAFSADLGVLVTPIPRMNVGLSVMNLGTKMKINLEEYEMPVITRFGVSYQLDKFIPAADFVYYDSDLRFHLGGEYVINEVLFLRAGYRSGYDTKEISAGAGFAMRNFRIDYAFLPYDEDDLGDSHIFTLTFSL
jgi:hypothetical protein